MRALQAGSRELQSCTCLPRHSALQTIAYCVKNRQGDEVSCGHDELDNMGCLAQHTGLMLFSTRACTLRNTRNSHPSSISVQLL